jgi:peptidoglycan/LPS O-acetylase OafA/YrhL
VFLVVAYHAGIAAVPGGFVGVDVFFVLSGYLITGLLLAEWERTGGVALGGFYARRVRRLLPASALVTLVTIAAAVWVLSPLEQARLWMDAFATSAYASNLRFARYMGNYFGADLERNPFLHTWSLAVEEQFYLLWPVLVLLGARFGRGRRGVLVTVAAVSAISVAACVWMSTVRQPWAFFGTPMRAWEFGLGALAGSIGAEALGARQRWVLGWAGAAMVLGAAAMYTSSLNYPGTAVLLPAFGTACILAGCANDARRGVGRVLSVPPLQVLGKLSYSWYLWHWPVLVVGAALIPGLSVAGRVASAVIALALAAATYALVEAPVRAHAALTARPRATLVLFVAVTSLGLGAALGFGAFARFQIARSPQQRAFLAAAEDRSPLIVNGCFTRLTDVDVRECVFGGAGSDTTVVLFGDSHAAAWFPAVESVARARGWRLVTMVKVGCPAPQVTVHYALLGRTYRECTEWRRRGLARIAALRPELVIVGTRSARVNAVQDGGVLAAEWGAGYRATLRQIASTGARSILLRDVPDPNRDVPICLSRVAGRGGDARAGCRFARGEALNSAAIAAEEGAARAVPGTSIVDLTDAFCGVRYCDSFRDGMPVYSDHSHMTSAYSRSLAELLGSRIDAVL